jgi:predicted protein tyrosine phosphatase
MNYFWPVFVGIFLLAAAGYAWWHFVEYRLTVISRGKVYTSAAMSVGALEKTVKRLGLRTVVDLRGPQEGEVDIKAEKDLLQRMGVHHLNLDSPQVPPDELRDRYLDWLSEEEHRPALIHCNHGQGRAVLYGALWRIEAEGMDPETARKKCRFLTTRGSTFDLQKAKGKYLNHYRPAKR